MTRRVAACQFEPTIGDVDENLDRIEALARQADADLTVFPELCVTGYDLETATERATSVPGGLTEPLVGIANRTDTELVVGLPEQHGDVYYNSFVLVDDSGVAATYRKCYPWGDESSVFSTGDGPVVADTGVGRVGFQLCYDLNFPELSLAYANRDCDVLAVGSAWRTSFREDWRLLLRARALDNCLYTVGANHTGDQSGREHAGSSLVANPRGEVVTEAAGEQATTTATVLRSEIETATDQNPVAETRASLERRWQDATELSETRSKER